jgi:hypothetical protein
VRHTVRLFAVFLAAAATPAFAATNLVSNGDFTELTNGLGQLNNNTNATDWSTTGYNFVFNTADQAVPQGGGSLALWDAANGGNNTWNGTTLSGAGNFLAMDGDYNTGPVTQSVGGLVVGHTYDLTFNYAFGQQEGFDGATIQSLAVDIGSTAWDSGNIDVANHGFTGWQSGSVAFTATSTSETLSFLATGNLPVPPFALASDVSVLSTPEPSTWVMMGLGFAGLGFAGFRSTRRKADAIA